MARRRSSVAGIEVSPPPPEVAYERTLSASGRGWPFAVFGIILGIATFVLLSGTVAQLLILAFWKAGLIEGGTFAEATRAGAAFTTPWGMLAVHLGLAMLIPISLALVLAVHRTAPGWLCSVRPLFRWPLLGWSMLAGLVLLNLTLWASWGWSIPAIRPQEGLAGFLVVILLTSPLQAAAEEFFFRGYLMQALGSFVRTPWLPIAGSALIFAAFHGTQNLPLFLDRFGFGLLAGFLVSRTGGLEAAIGLHIVNNILAFSYAALTSSVAQVKAVQQVGWIDLGWDLAGFALCTVTAVLLARRLRVATRTPASPVRSGSV